MSESPLALIAGLGNPGPEYQGTRHNAGFWMVDELARRYGSSFGNETRFSGLACKISVGGHSVWLLKPMTFMNRSGRAVAQLMRFYKLSPEQVLIAHDELDLPGGTVRLKLGGGHGGHNGLRDIVAQIGSRDFARLRIGIDRPPAGGDVTGYVLRRTPASDRASIETAIDSALGYLDDIVAGNLSSVMNQLHRSGAAASR